MWRRVAHVRTDVWEERVTFITKVKKRMASSGMLRRMALVRATRRNIPRDAIIQSHRRENLRSYKVKRIGELGTTLAVTSNWSTRSISSQNASVASYC
jgi:hypothetical protein